MNNPGRYLTLLPPINGATAISGTPYFTENAGDRAQMHDGTITFDYMPSQFITFRLEKATATPTCRTGPAAAASRLPAVTTAPRALRMCRWWSLRLGLRKPRLGEKTACGEAEGQPTGPPIWWPDLRTNQTVTTIAIKVRF